MPSTGSVCAIAAAVGIAIGVLTRRRWLQLQRKVAAAVPKGQLDPSDFEIVSEDRTLRRIETVLQRRTQKVVMVLERLNDGHNYAAILRTCETFGVQYVYLVSPPRSEEDLFDSAAKAKVRAADIEIVKREREKAAAAARRTVGDENDTEQASGQQNGGEQPSGAVSKRHRRRLKRLTQAATFVLDEQLGTDASHIAFARRALRFLTLRTFDSVGECMRALRADGREVWATDLGQAASVLAPGAPWLEAAGALPEKLALVVGSESTGVSRDMLAACDRRVYLPQNGFADSLNASVAAALALQTVLLLYGGRACGDLAREASPATLRALRLQWIDALARGDEHAKAMGAAAEAMPPPLDDLRRADTFREHTGRPVASERRRANRQQLLQQQQQQQAAHQQA